MHFEEPAFSLLLILEQFSAKRNKRKKVQQQGKLHIWIKLFQLTRKYQGPLILR